MNYSRIGLFYQMNKNDEYLLLYSHSEEERSLDEWIEIFSTNVYFMTLGRYSLWSIDENNKRINKIIDNHEIKNLLDNDKSLKYLLLEIAEENKRK